MEKVILRGRQRNGIWTAFRINALLPKADKGDMPHLTVLKSPSISES